MNAISKRTLQRFENATTFYEQLKLALEFHHTPSLLTQHSPLAKPYFLYQHTRHDEREASKPEMTWGEVLCKEINDAARALWGNALPTDSDALLKEVDEAPSDQANRYHFLVLELNFFKRIYTPPPKSQAVIYNNILHIGRTTHDRHLRDAIEELGKVLLERVRPTLRLESPSLRELTIGRHELVMRGLNYLQTDASVSLVGPSGVGKTVTGSLIADGWPSRSVFWFTIRPNFNDQLSSLLFSLGYFLHQQHVSSLWLQLVADKGEIKDINLVLSLALADLDALYHSPLLVIDEADMLHTPNSNQENPHHLQVLNFLERLQSHVAILLIGQRAVLETTITQTVNPFSSTEVQQWLTTLEIDYTEKDLARLVAYTDGNPRMIALCLSLHLIIQADQKTSFADTILQLPQTPGLAPIWDRLHRRLSIHELRILQGVSVFRSPAPRDAWRRAEGPETTATGHDLSFDEMVEQLIARQLLQTDANGSIYLLPTLRSIIYQETPIELRDSLHVQAAHICAMRGEFTEAAYHFSTGGLLEPAIYSWFYHRDEEIQRGQADVALAIFEQISAHKVNTKAQRQLALIRGMLCRLLGNPEKAIENIEQIAWGTTDENSILALSIWGSALGDQDDSDKAHQKFEEAIQVAANLLHESSRFHVENGLIFLRGRELQAARTEAKKARYHVEMLEGIILAQTGDFEAALIHHQSALSLAVEFNDCQAKGRSHYYLAISYMQQQNFALAFHHYQCGIQEYRAGRFRLQEAHLCTNLASGYLGAGSYQEAINEATAALTFFEKIKSPVWSACNSNTIAESYFELGDLLKAEAYAMQTIGYEETHYFPYGLYTIASVRRAQKKVDEAEKLYAQSCQIAEENEDSYLLAYAQRALGEVYGDMGRKQDAVEQIQSALALFQRMKIQPEIEKTTALLDDLRINASSS